MRNEQLAVGKLSGGNQQKVMLAKWLISAPKLLMLDEPTRGVDIGAKADVHQLIRDVADQGTPILVVSSDLPEILTLCDRIGVMNKGRLVQILSQQEATQEKIMELATQ
jgi:ribose transport system ATP-binding protein